MTCAACGTSLALVTGIGGVAICPSCLRTVVVDSGALATATETLALSAAQIEALKAQRRVARQARGL